jgi:hypothetical protein
LSSSSFCLGIEKETTKAFQREKKNINNERKKKEKVIRVKGSRNLPSHQSIQRRAAS